MQISYLWIERFRNIERQGFAFSARYHFTYHKETNEISIQRNARYLSDFFGERISSVTGLIGQNASGKTNLLEVLLYVMGGANTKIAEPFFILLEDNEGKLSGYHYEMSPPWSSDISFKEYKNEVEEFDAIFISNVFDGRRHNFDKKIKDLSTNNLAINKFGENFHTLYNKEIQGQIKFVNSNQFALLEDIERELHQNEQINFYPTHIRLASPSWGNIQGKVRHFDQSLKRITEVQLPSLEKFTTTFRRKMTYRVTDEKAIVYFTAFLVYLDFLINGLDDKDIFKEGDKRAKYIDDLKSFLIDVTDKFELEDFLNIISRQISVEIDKRVPHEFERFKFLYELDSYAFVNIIKEEQGKYSSKRIEFLIPYERRIGNFIKKYLDVVSSGTLTYSFEWEGISSGHKAYLSLFSRFYDYYQKKRSQRDNILVCIDEGDLYFHPKWQTEFLYKLINILPKLFKDEVVQIVLTTHSPFLVSDLPKDNLLFLRKNHDGKTTVVSSSSIHGETFGGNIGELYLDAFFLDGSLISQFALVKINGLVDNIIREKQEGRPISEYNRRLAEIIGEELIKNKIKKMIEDQ